MLIALDCCSLPPLCLRPPAQVAVEEAEAAKLKMQKINWAKEVLASRAGDGKE